MFHSLSPLAQPAFAQPASSQSTHADWPAVPAPSAYTGPDRRSPCLSDTQAAGTGRGATGRAQIKRRL
jgi:hypothetical protein